MKKTKELIIGAFIIIPLVFFLSIFNYNRGIKTGVNKGISIALDTVSVLLDAAANREAINNIAAKDTISALVINDTVVYYISNKTIGK